MTKEKSAVWAACQETKKYIEDHSDGFVPEVGMVLGSGLGGFADKLEVVKSIPYEEIPHFKPCKVAGHAGCLILGRVGGKNLLCQQGRYHFYEGHPIRDVVFPIRVMSVLGVRHLVVTNAAGGINQDFRVGDIMLIRDHINMQGTNPLIGKNEGNFGPRFPDMSFAYDREHAALFEQVASDMNLKIKQGVYLSVSGPSYETPAEIRMFRTLGADAVGMSTVPEVIVANHCGLRVLGLSCISNAAAGMSNQRLSHDDVKEIVNAMGTSFENLVIGWLQKL